MVISGGLTDLEIPLVVISGGLTEMVRAVLDRQQLPNRVTAIYTAKVDTTE